MKIAVIGLNHKTAPIGVREKLAFSGEQTLGVLADLKARFSDTGFVVLSTCNRTEIYFACPEDGGPARGDIVEFLSSRGNIPPADFAGCLYEYCEKDAVQHLLKVTASLDSLVVGEGQIIAQVKESYSSAAQAEATNKVLNRLFHCAFATSKEVYSVTSIAQRRISIAGVAIELARQLVESIARARVAVIGAGEMGELLIRHLLDMNCRDITVYNRSVRRAETLAERYDINCGFWDELGAAVGRVDIIVAAANAEEHLFDRSFLAERQAGALLIIDIAMPRNFAPDVNDLDGVYLYSVDDLAQVVEENMAVRQEDAKRAGEIIADNTESFMDWFGVMDIGPQIGRLRKTWHEVSRAELAGFLAAEQSLSPELKEKMQLLTDRIVNKLLHRVITGMYHVARESGYPEVSRLIERVIASDGRDASSSQEDTT